MFNFNKTQEIDLEKFRSEERLILIQKKIDALASYFGLEFIPKSKGGWHKDRYVYTNDYIEPLDEEESGVFTNPDVIGRVKLLVEEFKKENKGKKVSSK